MASSHAQKIGPKENLLFFHTLGYEIGPDSWEIHIHAWAYDLKTESKMRKLSVRLFAKVLGLSEGESKTHLFRRRARLFLVDNLDGKKIGVELAGQKYDLGRSRTNGHIISRKRLSLPSAKNHSWLSIKAASSSYQKSRFRADSGRVLLLKDEGLTVISDIDDTIKVSNVEDKKELLKNSFLREYKAVSGMATLYRKWEKGLNASFYYVSASPWQLYEPLEEFVSRAGFPKGPISLRNFRWKDSTFFDLFDSPEKSKKDAIIPMIERFKKRRFILVGDSGEKDPEIFGQLARRYPSRIEAIFIRNVSNEGPRSSRYTTAFRNLKSGLWKIFEKGSDLQ